MMGVDTVTSKGPYTFSRGYWMIKPYSFHFCSKKILCKSFKSKCVSLIHFYTFLLLWVQLYAFNLSYATSTSTKKTVKFTLDIQGHLLRFGIWTPKTYQSNTVHLRRYSPGCLGFDGTLKRGYLNNFWPRKRLSRVDGKVQGHWGPMGMAWTFWTFNRQLLGGNSRDH